MSNRSAEKTIDMTARQQELARTKPGSVPVISVYLDTRWSDEHQREALRLAVPFPDTFVVADMPQLRPLTEQGAADEIALETTDVVGHHRRGGWQLLLQSRYQRHIHVHRARTHIPSPLDRRIVGEVSGAWPRSCATRLTERLRGEHGS